MQKCGNCVHWKCTINFFCGCEKSSHSREKRLAEGRFCAWWQGLNKDKNYDLMAINMALQPLGITFEELFTLRYDEVRRIEIELLHQESVRPSSFDVNFTKYKDIKKELELMREILIYGRRLEPCKK